MSYTFCGVPSKTARPYSPAKNRSGLSRGVHTRSPEEQEYFLKLECLAVGRAPRKAGGRGLAASALFKESYAFKKWVLSSLQQELLKRSTL